MIVKRAGLWVCAAVLAAASATAGAQESAFDRALAEHVGARGLSVSPAFEKAVRDGSLELRSRNYLPAAHYFDTAYRESKEHPLPSLLIGLACIGMGEFDKASMFLRHAMAQWPAFPKAGLDLHGWLLDAAEYDRLAENLERELFGRAPGTPEGSRALFLAGFFAAFGGDREKAAKYVKAVPEGATERAAARVLLAALAPPPAPAASPPPEDPFRWGNELFVAGRWAEAAHAYAAAVARNPKDPLPYFEMGHALFAAGWYRHAARVLALGVELCPGWGGVAMDRAAFYPEDRRSDFRAQLDGLRGWIAEHPRDGAAQYLLGYNLYFSPDPSSSRGAFEAAAAAGWKSQADYFLGWLDRKPVLPGEPPPAPGPVPDPLPPRQPPLPPPAPEPATDWLALGRGQLVAGDLNKAIAAFSRAQESPKTRVEALVGMAGAWLGKGDFQSAALFVRNALRAGKDRALEAPWGAAFGAGLLYGKRTAELTEQVEASHRAREAGAVTEPQDRELWFLLGWCLLRDGKADEGSWHFNQIILDVGAADPEAFELFRRIKKG